VFAAYKALKSPTPATLAPWLTFYTTLSILHLLESTVLYPLSYLPLYSLVRLAVHLYLLFPDPNGATLVYNTYIYPFIADHELQIEDFISDTHDRVKAAGYQYFHQIQDWIRVQLLGQEPRPAPPQQSPYQSYAQQLLSRFYSTSSTGTAGVPHTQNDLYSAVFSALQGATASRAVSTEATAALDNLSGSGHLIPPALSNPEDRLSYIRRAREGLGALMQAFDREEGDIAAAERAGEPLSKSRSEADFDRIERDEVSPDRSKSSAQRTPSGSWMPWNWSAKGPDAAGVAKKDEGPATDDVLAEGRSTGLNLDG
jgi:receptor expression-enhancing protein 1/2/3/4